VLEHVIGFHDVLILVPLEAKPVRPKGDPEERWNVTVDALFTALSRPGALDAQRQSLVGVLTTDVLVHTWDLSKATGVAVTLDARLSQIGLDRAVANKEKFEGSDMFGPPLPISDGAAVQDRLLAFFGRDPDWAPPAV
jgi:uncharacterized protein (TIGR03086 family)